MNYVHPSVYARLLDALNKNADLRKFRAQLIGHCCRQPPDSAVRNRLLVFLTQHPEFRVVIEGVLYPSAQKPCGGCG